MPSTYAHYRFGVAMLPGMPGDVRRTIGRFRRLFDVGLHGPDIFFYNPMLRKGASESPGRKFHKQNGRDFFQRVCRVTRMEKSEAAQAYLYGVLCHYVLDSACHPFVNEQSALGPATHFEMETEFDRFLLELDGKRPPESQDMSPHLHLTPGECETVAKFYPGATARSVGACVANMARCTKLFATPDGARRTVLRKSMEALGPKVSGLLMTVGPNPRCANLDHSLLELYNRAVEAFPEMLVQIQAHLTYNGSLGDEFDDPFC